MRCTEAQPVVCLQAKQMNLCSLRGCSTGARLLQFWLFLLAVPWSFPAVSARTGTIQDVEHGESIVFLPSITTC